MDVVTTSIFFSKRPSAEECHENRWLLPTDYMIKKRERAVFLGNRLKVSYRMIGLNYLSPFTIVLQLLIVIRHRTSTT